MRKFIKFLSFITGVAAVFTLLYNYVFFVIAVPSASMVPAIKIDDRIITSRIHDFSTIKRGDILVFRSDEMQETMIKRVIGLPGDTVEIGDNGDVYVNSRKLSEPYVKYRNSQSGSFTVPEGEYFFLGDARSHSYDSRRWADPFIPRENVLGKAEVILFPLQRISFL